MGAEKQAKGKLKARQAGDKESKTPAGCHSDKVSQCRKRSNPGDARGEAPCIRKLKFSPFPPGRGVGGMGAEKQAKGRAERQPQPPSPPAGYHSDKVIR